MILSQEQKQEAQQLANTHGSLGVYWDAKAESFRVLFSEEERPPGLSLVRLFRKKLQEAMQ